MVCSICSKIGCVFCSSRTRRNCCGWSTGACASMSGRSRRLSESSTQRDASYLSIYDSGVGLFSVQGGCNLEAWVKLSEPAFFDEHECQVRALAFTICVAELRSVTIHSTRNSIFFASRSGHRSGMAVKQCSSSEVSASVIFGSLPPVGWHRCSSAAVFLLCCVCAWAAIWTL